jgi:molybdopterin synthase catalytic subunit
VGAVSILSVVEPLSPVAAPEVGDWLALTSEPLPVDRALAWAVLPGCGAVVAFCGTVRDHADGRDGVTELEYEAYESQVVPRLAEIAASARQQWPEIGRLALLHRTGRLELGATSVAVVASTPHRAEAFDSARFCIDTLKATVPIWKREIWAGGADWGTGAKPVTDVGTG